MIREEYIKNLKNQGKVTVKDLAELLTFTLDKGNELMLKDRPVYVHKGRLFSSVNISTEEESEEEKRQKILKKLSPEERRILGIEE